MFFNTRGHKISCFIFRKRLTIYFQTSRRGLQAFCRVHHFLASSKLKKSRSLAIHSSAIQKSVERGGRRRKTRKTKPPKTLSRFYRSEGILILRRGLRSFSSVKLLFFLPHRLQVTRVLVPPPKYLVCSGRAWDKGAGRVFFILFFIFSHHFSFPH